MEIFKYNRRNMLVLVVVLVLTAVLFFAWYCYKGLTGTSGDRGNIPYPAVRSTGSIFKPLARKSVQSIVDITLDNTGYIRWKACTGELDVLIEEADLLLGKADEVLVALSLSPQEGLVACYTREGGRLNYVGKIPNLLPVTGIWTLGNTRLENRLLIVEQVQDEMLGAFFNARYSDVFLPGDGHFDRVLGLLTNYNAYWNRAWDGVKEDASWLWLNQSAKVEYSDTGETIWVDYVQTLLESMVTDTDSIPEAEGFAARYFRMVKEEYKWSSDWGLYILGEYTDSQTGERVALLEDYRNNVSSFIRGTRFDMVKVIDQNGEISIMSADRLQ